MRQEFFSELTELYEKLDQALPKACGNPCGDCFHCCTTAELAEHRVTALEIDLVEERFGSERISEFQKFLARTPDMVCPYYENGCSIYSVRPYSCRVFGHFRREDTPLPQVCIFRGQEKLFGVSDHQGKLPQSARLTEISRQYWAHRVRRPSQEEVVYQAAGVEPDLAEALECLKRGELEKALELALLEPSQDPFSLYCKSLVSQSAGRHDLSEQFLLTALRQAPDSPDLWYGLATDLLALGRFDHAQVALERSLALYPNQGDAWGLLGLLHLSHSNGPEAVECLRCALAELPDHPVYSARLNQALLLVREP